MNAEQAYEWLAPKLSTEERQVLDVLREKNAELQRQLESAQDYRDKATKTRDEMTDKYFAEKDRADGLQLVLQRERDEAAKQEPVGFVAATFLDLQERGTGSMLNRKAQEGFPQVALYALPPHLPALIEQAKEEERERLGKLIHYPECWDTACYQTLDDALTEIGCNPDCCARSETK